MKLVDAHVHLFEKFAGIKNGQPVTSDAYGKVKVGNEVMRFLPPYFEKSNSPVELYIEMMDCNGIDKAVLLPNVLYGYHNEYCCRSMQEYPGRFKAAVLVDIVKGKKAADELEKWIRKDGFCGLKIEVETALQCVPGTELDDERIRPVWDTCNELQTAVFIHPAGAGDLNSIKGIMKKYTKIKYVFCHMGAQAVFGDKTSDELLAAARKNDNLWLELSSLPYFIGDRRYPFEGAADYLKKAVNAVGAEKIIWGTDYPGMLKMATYKQLLDYAAGVCGSMNGKQTDMILGGNALRLFWGE